MADQDGSEDRIRQRAYELWEQEGRPEGRDRHHWEQASGEKQTGGGSERTSSPPERPKGETRLSPNASVDQLTPAEATAATMRDSPRNASRQASEPGAKTRKPL
jgi:hypothetical protein